MCLVGEDSSGSSSSGWNKSSDLLAMKLMVRLCSSIQNLVSTSRRVGHWARSMEEGNVSTVFNT